MAQVCVIDSLKGVRGGVELLSASLKNIAKLSLLIIRIFHDCALFQFPSRSRSLGAQSPTLLRGH